MSNGNISLICCNLSHIYDTLRVIHFLFPSVRVIYLTFNTLFSSPSSLASNLYSLNLSLYFVFSVCVICILTFSLYKSCIHIFTLQVSTIFKCLSVNGKCGKDM